MTTMTKPKTNGHDHKPNGIRTYRARSLDELIPKIRTELGPDAIILRQREGLTGGIGGFFAQRCVEVEAQAPSPKIDLYDDTEDALPEALEAPRAALPPAPKPVAAPPPQPQPDATKAEPSLAELIAAFEAPSAPEPVPAALSTPEASPFAAALAKAAAEVPAAYAPERSATPAETTDEAYAAALVRELTDSGISEPWARELVASASAHWLPFGGDLRGAVRSALAASIPAATPLPASGARIAFAGADLSGKTRLTAALAAAYRRASALRVRAVALGPTQSSTDVEQLVRSRRELKELLSGHDVPVVAAAPGRGARNAVEQAEEEVVVIDAGPLAPETRAEVKALADELKALEVDATYVALPATLRADAARKLAQRLKPLKPAGLAVTHADRTDQLGVAAELAHATGLPIVYVHEGIDPGTAMSAVDPLKLAARILP